jgi:hypothetical protein
MNSREPKVTLSASVDPSFKERFETIAKSKRWTLSRTVEYFIEEYLDQWEKDLGIEEEPKPTPKKGHKPKSIA